MSGLDLQGCNLNEANLAGANLAGCDLRGTGILAADLRGANLRDSDIRTTPMHRARMQECDLRGAKFEAIGEGRQLICTSPLTFDGARWDKARLEEILKVLNMNRDWEIRWELVPRG